jgi:hypothetical protein
MDFLHPRMTQTLIVQLMPHSGAVMIHFLPVIRGQVEQLSGIQKLIVALVEKVDFYGASEIH